MIKLAIVAALAIVSAGLFYGATHLSDSEAHFPESAVAFEFWIGNQNKAYISPEEKNFRKTIFLANLKKVEQSNKVNSFVSAVNRFSDLTTEEFLAKHTGLQRNYNEERSEVFLDTDDLKAQVDWRTKGAVVDVKDQGPCGSCWAFSTTAAVESAHFIKHGQLVSLSEQQLMDCSKDFGNNSCQGGLMTSAFKYLLKAGGQMSEKDYPYTAKDGTKCKFDKSKVVAQITKYTQVPANNCDQLVAAANTSPVSVAVDATQFVHYKSGIFEVANCGTGLNHGVTLEGYGDDYFLVKNSWGTTWGEAGYIRLSRKVQKTTGMCGICMDASYPTAL